MLKGLLDALVELHRSVGRVRLVCVHAAGDIFCAGLHESTPVDCLRLQHMLFLFQMLPMYVLGVVEGEVNGLGVALCSTFDALAMKHTGHFNFQGLTAHYGGEFVAARIGAPLLEELCEKGAQKTAAEALALGLASYVFQDQQGLKAHIEKICQQVSECAPNAVAEAKPFLHQVGTATMDLSMLHTMSRHIARRQMDPEFKDSITAISVEGHRPIYNRYEWSKVAPAALGQQESR